MPLDVNDLPDPEELDLEIEIPDMQIDTLGGDVRDVLLGVFKTHRKTWSDMTQTEQNMLVEGVGKAGRDLVKKIVQALTGWDYPRAVGRIADMKVIPGDKSRIEAKLAFARIDDNLTALGRHVGDQVVVLMFDSDNLMGERGPARTDPDQPDLPMGDPALQRAGDELAPELDAEVQGDGSGEALPEASDEEREAPAEPLSDEEVAAAQSEIATESAEFEASAEELERQTTRGKIKAGREAAA